MMLWRDRRWRGVELSTPGYDLSPLGELHWGSTLPRVVQGWGLREFVCKMMWGICIEYSRERASGTPSWLGTLLWLPESQDRDATSWTMASHFGMPQAGQATRTFLSTLRKCQQSPLLSSPKVGAWQKTRSVTHAELGPGGPLGPLLDDGPFSLGTRTSVLQNRDVGRAFLCWPGLPAAQSQKGNR